MPSRVIQLHASLFEWYCRPLTSGEYPHHRPLPASESLQARLINPPNIPRSCISALNSGSSLLSGVPL